MFCSKCGKQIDDSAMYCQYCAHPTQNTFMQGQQPEAYQPQYSPYKAVSNQAAPNYTASAASDNSFYSSSANIPYTGAQPYTPPQAQAQSWLEFEGRDLEQRVEQRTVITDNGEFTSKTRVKPVHYGFLLFLTVPLAFASLAFSILLFVEDFFDYRGGDLSDTHFFGFVHEPIYVIIAIALSASIAVFTVIALARPTRRVAAALGLAFSAALFLYMTLLPVIGLSYTLKNYNYVIFLSDVFYVETSLSFVMMVVSFIAYRASLKARIRTQ